MDEIAARTHEKLTAKVGLQKRRGRRNVALAAVFGILTVASLATSIVIGQSEYIYVGTIFLAIAASFALQAIDANEMSREIGERQWKTMIPRFAKSPKREIDEEGAAVSKPSLQPVPSGVGSMRTPAE